MCFLYKFAYFLKFSDKISRKEILGKGKTGGEAEILNKRIYIQVHGLPDILHNKKQKYTE